ncbi:MAG: PQQ-dependent sugar dehydrogenase [Saprospiraceae bacterium]|nr:PQQ-dependent sugar dehydrogenase [Saprospiraceae bacterium]
MKINLLTTAFLVVLYILKIDAQSIQLEVVNATFDRPVDIKNAGDNRLFIVEKIGRIQIMDLQGNKNPQPFLDISGIVNAAANERGLLGLAFHPDYDSTGYFFVNYTGAGGHTRISRFTRSAINPDFADPATEKLLLLVNQPFNNHNAGDLAFGPDGYLYVGMGDGGSGGDPGNRSQNPQEYLGKMLRLDVDTGDPYAIPADNPFTSSIDTLPEIWSLGLRNPWRISFDRMTGDFWIADVGQDKWEEIDFEPAGSAGGRNYGWRCYEGFEAYNTSGCGPQASYDPPVYAYANTGQIGCSITGGYVYRGTKIPALYGKYVYTDFCTGFMWTLEPDGNGSWENATLFKGKTQEYVAFGEDIFGELYVAGLGDGTIYKFITDCALTAETTPVQASCNSVCDGSLQVVPNGGFGPYMITLSNGMVSSNGIFEGLCAGIYIVNIADSAGCTFDLEVIIEEPAPLVPALIASSITCFGSCDGRLELSATGGCAPHTFSTNGPGPFASSDSLLESLCPGLYQIKVTDCLGCISTIEYILTEPDSLSIELVALGDSLFATAGFMTYRWFRDGILLEENSQAMRLTDSSGIYMVEVVDSNGCIKTSNEVLIEISSLDQLFTNQITVTPNPFVHSFHVSFNREMKGKMVLKDVHSRLIATWEGPFQQGAQELSGLSKLPDGLYFLVWIGEDGLIGAKRVVKSGNSF